MDRERSVIACPKFFQTFTAIAVQRLIVPDALAEEQSPDTIDMQNPLGDQRFALSAKAAAILFLGRRHPNHRANAWFPPLVSHQGADQRLTIDAIVFTRRCRRGTAIDAASTTWLSIQSSRFSTRSIQNPSRPASWITTNG